MHSLNIVYIHSHDTGRYIQPYGHAVSTPNLQRLAEQGVLFRQAFSASPICSPSRASLLTGQYPHCNGLLGLAVPVFNFSLPHPERLLTQVLRRAGYQSMLAGLQHVVLHNEIACLGYDHIFPSEKIPHPQRDEAVAHAAIDFVQTKPHEPFFLDVGFFDTHRPFPEPDPENDPRYCRPSAFFPDMPETRSDMAAFKTAVHRLDQHIGMVIDALDVSGLSENTLVICTTDHGLPFPSMKGTLTDGGLETLLIMRGPDPFRSGAVIDALVSQIDIFPTLCELLAIPAPPWLQGYSLFPVLTGMANEVRDELFAETNFQNAYEPQRCIRTKRWKYIRHFGTNTHRVRANCDPGGSRDVLIAHGWNDRPIDHEMLFDLIFDPMEKQNLVPHPAFQAVRNTMRDRLEEWMQETDDPLLSGPLPVPSGGTMLDPDKDLAEIRLKTMEAQDTDEHRNDSEGSEKAKGWDS